MNLNLKEMSRQDKLIAMEALWSDLSGNEHEVESPAWHESALKETEAKVNAGLEQILDWEDAKEKLRSHAR